MKEEDLTSDVKNDDDDDDQSETPSRQPSGTADPEGSCTVGVQTNLYLHVDCSDETDEGDSADYTSQLQPGSEQYLTVYSNSSSNKHTAYKTRADMRTFTDWAKAKGEVRQVNCIPETELDQLLAKFYLTARKRDGSEYEPTSLTGFQCSIDRYLRFKNSSMCIKRDMAFSYSRRVLVAKCKELKSLGKGRSSKKDVVTPEDLKMLYEKRVIGEENPQALLRALWLNNVLHFGFRNREDHSNLKWGDIQLKEDRNGMEYLQLSSGNIKGTEPRKLNLCVLAEHDNPYCPIKIYKIYLSHRPAQLSRPTSRFYLRPVDQPKGKVWYCNQPMGKNTIAKFPQEILEEGNLLGRRIVSFNNHPSLLKFWPDDGNTLNPQS